MLRTKSRVEMQSVRLELERGSKREKKAWDLKHWYAIREPVALS